MLPACLYPSLTPPLFVPRFCTLLCSHLTLLHILFPPPSCLQAKPFPFLLLLLLHFLFSSPFLSHHRLTLCPSPLSSFCVHYLLWLSCLPSLSWSVPFICSRTIRPFYSFKQGKLLQGLVIVKVSPLCLPSQECTLTTHHRLITTPLPFHCHHVSTTALHQHLL